MFVLVFLSWVIFAFAVWVPLEFSVRLLLFAISVAILMFLRWRERREEDKMWLSVILLMTGLMMALSLLHGAGVEFTGMSRPLRSFLLQEQSPTTSTSLVAYLFSSTFFGVWMISIFLSLVLWAAFGEDRGFGFKAAAIIMCVLPPIAVSIYVMIADESELNELFGGLGDLIQSIDFPPLMFLLRVVVALIFFVIASIFFIMATVVAGLLKSFVWKGGGGGGGR